MPTLAELILRGDEWRFFWTKASSGGRMKSGDRLGKSAARVVGVFIGEELESERRYKPGCCKEGEQGEKEEGEQVGPAVGAEIASMNGPKVIFS